MYLDGLLTLAREILFAGLPQTAALGRGIVREATIIFLGEEMSSSLALVPGVRNRLRSSQL